MVEKCLKYCLTLEQLFILESIFWPSDLFTLYITKIGISEDNFQKLRRYAYIQKINPDLPYIVDDSLQNLEITEKGKSILIDKVEAVAKQNLDWVQEYRALFKGVKAQAMGDRKACEDNIRWFMKRYPEFSKEQIIAAAKKHINDNANKPQYTRRADYFIKKADANKNVTSDLLMYLENGDLDVPSDIMEQV